MTKRIFMTLLALVSAFAATALGQNNGAVNYIDADGNAAQCADYTLVDSSYPFGDDNGVATLGVDDDTERWYAIVDTINLDKPLCVKGNARIILSDVAFFNINPENSEVSAFSGSGSTLVIYGQLQGTGTLRAYNTSLAIGVSDGNNMTINGGIVTGIGCDYNFTSGICITNGGTLTINRGTVNATGTYCGLLVQQQGVLVINGGTVNATCNGTELTAAIGVLNNSTATINGGNVTATGIDVGWGIPSGICVNTNSILTFGWTNASDRITATKYYVGENSTLQIARDKPLSNGSEELEPGAVSDLTKLDGTLMPFIPEDMVLTASQTTWENAKVYLLNSDMTISERIMVNGSVRLVLGEGCTLNAPKGIELSAGNKLTIDGRGTLNINNCDTNKSGIGAYSVGKLIINGGTINATGGQYGAGLGGDIHNDSGGDIIINAGVVHATGGMRAAGIGGGYDDRNGTYGQCGTIIINGGQVTAIGGADAYAIGPGTTSDGDTSKSGTIVLGWSNPTNFIYATGGAGGYSPRIQSLSFAEGKTFMLDGTETEATLSNIEGRKIVPSKYGLRYDLNGDGKPTLADITLLVNMMSREDPYESLVPTSPQDVVLTSSHTTWEDGKTYLLNSNVTISERITVEGTVCLKLGTGCTLNAPKGIELSDGNKLTIDGRGTLNIDDCDWGKSGIGALEVGMLTINGGTINTTGGLYAAGIGGDYENTNGGTIVINGGVVNATGDDYAAGIGGGRGSFGAYYGVCGNIFIFGGQVTAIGGREAYGFGPGYSHSIGNTNKSGLIALAWTLNSDFIYATGDRGGFSVRTAQIIVATDTPFLYDGTNDVVTAKTLIPTDPDYPDAIWLGGSDSPKMVPAFPNTGLRGDMDGDGKLTPDDLPLLMDSVLYVTDGPVPVSYITLSPTEMRLDSHAFDAPSAFYLSFTVGPRNATNKELEWSSTNRAIAGVEGDNKSVYVWAEGAEDGECYITATAKDGSGVSASCKVTVFTSDHSHENY